MSTDTDRRHRINGAALDYHRYLRLDPLLRQQVPRADPPAHDELMFIVVHQAYELWFKLLVHELESIRSALDGGRVRYAKQLFGRVHAVQRTLLEQLEVLETMDPQDFLRFRSCLGTASGFQSTQFREVEFLAGAKESRYLAAAAPDSALRRRFVEPSIWDAFLGVLRRRGLLGARDDHDAVVDALREIGADRDTHGELWELVLALVQFDRLASYWRIRHLQVVEWMIGAKTGTGGSTGADYLRARVGTNYFPLLWELPTWL
jgi:tryptophan 2,3-dioxygenase